MDLKELSKMLGFSTTTVSRALNGYPEVSEATRAKVIAAAKQHHYLPNARAARLAAGTTKTIGHVIPTATRQQSLNPAFADFIAGAGETYSQAGFDMLLSIVSGEDEEKTYRELKSRGSVDGVIVHAPRDNDSRIKLLNELKIPFVVHGRASCVLQPYSWVDVNNRRAFLRATDFLINLGHRRIALINGLEFMDSALRRKGAYLDTLARHAIEPDAALMVSTEKTEANGYAMTRQMLDGPDPPTAFLVSSMIMAIGARRAIEERGLKLGKDISIITHDYDLSYMRNDADYPIFTATRASVREAGQLAASMLLDIICNRCARPLQRLLEAELIIGQSTGPAPSRR